VGQGLINAAEGFSKNFFHGQEVKDALAQKAAELTATQRHQQRLEDLQAQHLADQKEIEGAKLDQRNIEIGNKEGLLARHQVSPEETAMRDEADATIARRKSAGNEAITEMSAANAFNRIGQTPLAPRMGEKEYAGQFKNDPVLGFEDTLPASAEPPARFSGVNAATGGEMKPVQPSARPVASAQGEALAAAAAGVRERKNIDDEFKAQTEITKAEMQKIYDLEKQGMINDAQWAQTVQRGKDQIRASAASGTGRMKMEHDFIMNMAKEYRGRHPEFKTDAEAASHLEQLKKFEPVGSMPGSATKRSKEMLLGGKIKLMQDATGKVDLAAYGVPVGMTRDQALNWFDTQIAALNNPTAGALPPDEQKVLDGMSPADRAEWEAKQ
jgi:hypothetical protein